MTVEAAEPRSLLRRLYDWCLAAAHKPHALWTMGAVSFAESSFFPVPPDIMLIPMALARPDRAYVNRNMIGAVVGSQPFGGSGLSGTGPKAGGPDYLHRLIVEQVVTVNTSASGGNTTLLTEDE